MEPPIRTWEEAERRLYPSMVAQPEAVAPLLHLVRAVADELGRVDTVDALTEAWGSATAIVGTAAASQGLDGSSFDAETVAGAAFALRHRELAVEAERRARRRRIDDARSRNDAWVVLDESGSPEAPFPNPYHRLEMRLADGYGIRSTAELDPDSGAIVHAIEELELDADSGELVAPGGSTRRTSTDAHGWRRAIDELRRVEAPQPHGVPPEPR